MWIKDADSWPYFFLFFADDLFIHSIKIQRAREIDKGRVAPCPFTEKCFPPRVSLLWNTARIYWSYFQNLSLSLSLLQRHKTDEETFQKISRFHPCCQEPRLRHLGLGVAMVTTTSNFSWHKTVIQQLIKYRSQGLGKWVKFEALSLSV